MGGGAPVLLSAEEATLPPNQMISFPRSDGDPTRSKFPANTTEIVSAGCVDYYREVSPLEKSHVEWRKKIGTYLATQVDNRDPKLTYMLDAFPEHYVFMDHNKGPVDKVRHDLYLFGSQTVQKFRSPQEFIPHARFLYQTNTNDPCLCKYCSKNKSQQQISMQFGISSHRPPGGTPRGGTTVRRIAHAAKPASPPKQLFSKERNADLRTKRPIRVGELVWAALDLPIRGPHPDEVISFWPAIVMDLPRVKAYVSPHQPGELYDVRQELAYKLRLLGIMHVHVLPDYRILPYHAYILPMSFLQRLGTIPPPKDLAADLERLGDFHPFPTADDKEPDLHNPSFAEAAIPYALAIQIGDEVRAFWSPTDPWEFKTEDSAAPPERRFQGLWWGCERIWAGELVRLRQDRAGLADLIHNPLVKAPSSPAAAGRSLFLCINNIFADPPDEARPDHDVCRISGMLYELADPDWVEPPDDPTMPGLTLHARSHSSQSASTSASPSIVRTAHPTPSSSQASASASVNEGLSTPAGALSPSDPFAPFALPAPPRGLQWRALLPAGHEIVLPISLMAGRYYPGILENPLLQWDETSAAYNHSLAGLAPGEATAMACRKFRPTRGAQVQLSDEWARKSLVEHFQEQLKNQT
ncbi:hypothetical protein BOTBODRAFT_28137 [Botryobasidium botryosum FD-172 SS1]|uniref:Cryptic loci regulator 2 N-terminal domain-containing protein n=1 Tax=Botryobasidium botryosum (strain FD-172 SS1) TaxID=930990 RepID=A0A067MVC5_BOTB1|nr:hypothetical protein BOTBODRAFT_28137 [Botryobasidium botryosum FD-172 SS1]